MGEAGNETGSDRITGWSQNNRDDLCGVHRRPRRGCLEDDDDIDILLNQFSSQASEEGRVPMCGAVFQRNGTALPIAEFMQALAKYSPK